MKLGVLFSGGKDSCLAMLKAVEFGHKICCLITIESENKSSFMFHTPSISRVSKQAEVLKIPLIFVKTKGEKEVELNDLKKTIKLAVEKYSIDGIVTGAVESVYQSTRIQTICNNLKIECFNPLWQKNQLEILEELIKKKFEVILVGVFAYPFDKKWLGRKIDRSFIDDMKKLNSKFGINPAGEGGEFESFVLNMPMFSHQIKISGFEDFGEKNSWSRELCLE